jgi:regulator of protease activity HflC (stomatin/prohibitin superfamily)
MYEILGGILVFSIMLLLSGLKTVKEHDRLVVFRFGRLLTSKGPGVHLVLPIIDKTELVDVRSINYDSGALKGLTLDAVPVSISVLVSFKIVDPGKALLACDDVVQATKKAIESSTQELVGGVDLKELSDGRSRCAQRLKQLVEKKIRGFGIKLQSVEISSFQLERNN